MARLLRIEYEVAAYRVTSRRNAREAVFLDDTDWEKLLEALVSPGSSPYPWCSPKKELTPQPQSQGPYAAPRNPNFAR